MSIINFIIFGAVALSLHGSGGQPSVSEDFYFMEHYKNFSLENIVEEYKGIVYTEEWRDLPGYEGLYKVSSFGRIKNMPKTRPMFHGGHRSYNEVILSQRIGKWKYLYVNIYNGIKRKTVKIHRLAAQIFIDNPDNKPQVNHLFGNKIDNRVFCLEWVTMSENTIHAYKTGLAKCSYGGLGKFGKLSKCSIPINQLTKSGDFIKRFDAIADAFRETGVRNISSVLSGKLKSAGGFLWKKA